MLFVEFLNSTVDEKGSISIQEAFTETIEKKIEYKHKTKRMPSDRLKAQDFVRDRNICKLCDITVKGNNIHFDHIQAWSKNGETVLENLHVLCQGHILLKEI